MRKELQKRKEYLQKRIAELRKGKLAAEKSRIELELQKINPIKLKKETYTPELPVIPEKPERQIEDYKEKPRFNFNPKISFIVLAAIIMMFGLFMVYNQTPSTPLGMVIYDNLTNETEDVVEIVVQDSAEINKPVRWVKRIKLKESSSNLTVILPEGVTDIKVNKIVNETKYEINKFKLKKETNLIIEDNVTEVEIEYYTEAPQVIEKKTKRGKKVVISSETHYTNITAYADIPEAKVGSIKLYRIVNNTREETQITNYEDTNNNSLIDKIYWVVPHLSNETYEIIIEISKAEHLDDNRTFVEDVYDLVKARDNVWKEIPDDNYLRVTFEMNLTSSRDITIYARSSNGGSVGVYEKDSDIKIADFGVIGEDNKYKILLTNLVGTQDTFDLKVINGDVEFDYVVDPPVTVTYNYFSSNYGVDRWAYHVSASAGNDVPPANPWTWDTEFSTADYNAINDTDDSRAETSGGSSTLNPAHIFEFVISEDTSLINQLDFYWEGYGDKGSNELYFWNWSGSAWVSIGTHAVTGADGIITGSNTSIVTDYINESGYLELVAVDRGNKPTIFRTDYIYVNVTYTSADPYPYWSDNATDIVVEYLPTTESFFNITWQDTGGSISWVWFESNFSGSPVNYSMNTIDTDVYNYSAVMPAGDFYWKSHANDTSNQWNVTDTWSFKVNKSTGVIRLYINGSEDDLVENVSFAANITCDLTTPGSGNITIYEDGNVLNSTIGSIATYNKTYTTPDNYNITCSLIDHQNYTAVNQSWINATDEEAPTVSLDSPPISYWNDSSDPYQINFTCSVTDNNGLRNISLWLTNRTNESFILNSSSIITQSSNQSNWTLDLAVGNYTWNCLVYDYFNNSAWAASNRTILINWTPDYAPYWSDNQSYIVSEYSPTTYSLFNITWEDNGGSISWVWFESNFTGTPINYSMNNITLDIYNYSAILPAGDFYWRSYANDSINQWNVSPMWNFTVAQAGGVIRLYINSSENDFEGNISFAANITCNLINPTSGNITIYEGGSVLNTTIGSIATYNKTYSSVGDYNITCSLINLNYTGVTNQSWINATDPLPEVSLDRPADSYMDDINQHVNLTFNATVTDINGLVNCSLWHNISGTWGLNQSQNITQTSNITTFSLNLTDTAFIWNIECYDSAGQFDWDSNRTVILNWTDYSPYWGSNQTNITPIYSSTTYSHFNITWQDDNNLSWVWFESNFTGTPVNYSMNNITLDIYNYSAILPAGDYYWRSHANDSRNQWNVTDTWTFTVLKIGGAIKLYINGSENDFEGNVSFAANITCNLISPNEGNVTIYEGGVILNSTYGSIATYNKTYSAPADYNITCSLIHQNYTASNQSWINASSLAPEVTLDRPEDNYVNSTQWVNITFNATVADNGGLVNCSLWHNISGTWSWNKSQLRAGTTNVTEFNLTNLKNTSFIWNIECYNTGGGAGWDNNRTVTLNWTPNYPSTTPTDIECNDGRCDIEVDESTVLNCSGSTDPDGDAITYSIEAKIRNDTIIQNTTDNSFAGSGGEVYIWLEAEVFADDLTTLGSGWELCSATSACEEPDEYNLMNKASNYSHVLMAESYVTTPLNFTYDFPESGTYYLWGRSWQRTGDASARIWNVSIDGSYYSENFFGDVGPGTADWLWESDAVGKSISAGERLVQIWDGSPDTSWVYPDIILLTTNSTYNPSTDCGDNIDTVGGRYNNTACGLPEASNSETNSTPVVYVDFDGGHNTTVNITITVEVDSYNPSASVQQSTDDPDLFLEIYNGSEWIAIGEFGINESYGDVLNTTNYNFTLSTIDPTILTAWQNSSNQDIRIKGVHIDYYNSSMFDELNYTNVWVAVNGTNWNYTGNHTETTDFTWDTSGIPDQNCIDLRCRAIDLDGNKSYTVYYTEGTCLNLSHVRVIWNQSTLDLGNILQASSNTKNATVTISKSHTGITVANISGNGTFINATPLNLGSMSNGDEQEIRFNCSPSAGQDIGIYYAVFKVNSTEDPEGDNINISCTVSDPFVEWSQSSLDVGEVTSGTTNLSNVTVIATGDNTNINISEDSGTATAYISSEPIDLFNLNNGLSQQVRFNISPASGLVDGATYWAVYNVTSATDSIADQINISFTYNAEAHWNDTNTFNLTAYPSLQGSANRTVNATGDITNVIITEMAGDGMSFISATPLIIGSMSHEDVQQIEFICNPPSDQAKGYYAAIFNVNSTENTTGENLTVGCVVEEGPNITINTPVNGTTYNTVNLTLLTTIENKNLTPSDVWYTLNGAANITISTRRVGHEWLTYGMNHNRTFCSKSYFPRTNDLLWQLDKSYLGEYDVWGAPVVKDGVVYANGKGGSVSLMALNATTGAIIWQTNLTPTGPVEFDDGPVYHEGRLYMHQLDTAYPNNTTWCVNASTGEVMWNTSIPDTGASMPILNPEDDLLYVVGREKCLLFMLNMTNGSLMQEISIVPSNECDAATSPGTHYDDKVYVPIRNSSASDMFRVYNDTDLTDIIWQTSIPDGAHDTTPTFHPDRDVVYLGGLDGELHAFNATTGYSIWNYSTMAPDTRGVLSSISICNDVACGGNEQSEVTCVNATDGTFMWDETTTSGRVYSTPSVSSVDNILIWGGQGSRIIYADNLTDGSSIWTYGPIGDDIYGSSALVDGIAYFLTDNGLYAFGDQLKFRYEINIVAEEGINNLTVYTNNSNGAVVSRTIMFNVTLPNEIPTQPGNITCNNGSCNITVDTGVVLNCSNSTDVENDTITYMIEASLLNITTVLNTTNVSMTGSVDNYFYDVESGMETFTAVLEQGTSTAWVNSEVGGSGYYHSATYAFWADDHTSATRNLLYSKNFSISSSSADPKLRFWLRVITEDGFDGCWLDYSINGGAWTNVDDSMIDGGVDYDYSGNCGSNCPSGTHVAWENLITLRQINVSIPEGAKGNDIAFRWVAEADGNEDAGVTPDGCWVDDIEVTSDGSTNETNTTATNYTDMDGAFYTIANITVKIEVDSYDPSGSVNQSTDDPDLFLEMYNGSDWIPIGEFEVNESYGNILDTTNQFFNLTIVDTTVLTAWANSSNQDLRIKGVHLDYYNSTVFDEVNYTNVWVEINGSRWLYIGNHTNGTDYNWDTSNIDDQTGINLRCRAIDLSGSNNYSSYYTEGCYLNITHVSIDWNQTSVDIGGVLQGSSNTKNSTVTATNSHTGIMIRNVSGNGTGIITATPTDIASMSASAEQQIRFNCSPSAGQDLGLYQVVFNVNSSEYIEGDNITVNCTVSPISVSWSQNTLDAGTINSGNLTQLNVTVISLDDNTNINISEDSGTATAYISFEPIALFNLNNGLSQQVRFNISPTSGLVDGTKYWAVYNVTSDQDSTVDQINVSFVYNAEVHWNDTTLVSLTSYVGLSNSTNRTINATGDVTNVLITSSGNGSSFITATPTDVGSLSHGDIQQINFSCDPQAGQAASSYEAIFNVNSSENITGENITVSCEVLQTYGQLNVTLETPTPDTTTNVNQNESFWVRAIVSCSGTSGAFCGNVSANARYNSSGTASVGWWDTTWTKRKEINLSNGGGALSDFPVYLNISYDSDMVGDYIDLRFINGSCTSDQTAELAYEIENYTTTNAHIWFKIPDLYASGTTSLCMYYDNNTPVSDGQNIPGVWDDDYVMVLHLDEKSGTHYDSTIYGNNGTNDGSTQDAAGKIGGANNFLSNDKVQITHDITLNLTTAVTVEAWYNADSSGSWAKIVTKSTDSSSEQPYAMYGIMFDSSGGAAAEVGVGGTNFDVNSVSDITLNSWTYLVGTYDSDILEVFLHGKSNNTNGDMSGVMNHNENDVTVGGGGYDAEYFDGEVDEVRISRIVRSDDWINMSYQFVENQESFVANGSEETYSPSGLEIMTVINDTTEITPFYTLSAQTQHCVINQGESCQLSWSVNATGNISTYHKINVNFSSNYTQVVNNETKNATVNITFILADNPPKINLDRPRPNYVNSTDQWVNLTFNATVTDDYMLVNCSLWHNISGTWSLNQTQLRAGTSNTTAFNLTNLTNTSFIWNIECFDNNSQSAFNDTNRTVTLNWTAPAAFLITFNITKTFDPDVAIAGLNESINVTTTVWINGTTYNITYFNITDEVPYDFIAPSASAVIVTYINGSDNSRITITDNVTINITDRIGTNNTIVWVNGTNNSLGFNMFNDSIELVYSMISSKMSGNATRQTNVNVTVNDSQQNIGTGSLVINITAAQSVLRGYKQITNDPAYPANFTVNIDIRALGNDLTEILAVDYLPSIINEISDLKYLNVTYYNATSGEYTQLFVELDYNVTGPFLGTLPGNYPASMFNYNLSYNFTNWDGTIYENDSIHINYTVTVLGGGNWTLPCVIGGWDPQYQKHIRTEMYVDASVPSFDVITKVLTPRIKPGEPVRAHLTMLNVGGLKAKVDVFITYSAKTMEGELIAERSETLAVVERKEKELELPLPSTIEPGMYTFETFVTYTKREAMSTDMFEVIGEKKQAGFGKYVPYMFTLLMVVLLIVFIIIRTRKKPEIREEVPKF